jgi:hypothetical protein
MKTDWLLIIYKIKTYRSVIDLPTEWPRPNEMLVLQKLYATRMQSVLYIVYIEKSCCISKCIKGFSFIVQRITQKLN